MPVKASGSLAEWGDRHCSVSTSLRSVPKGNLGQHWVSYSFLSNLAVAVVMHPQALDAVSCGMQLLRQPEHFPFTLLVTRFK